MKGRDRIVLIGIAVVAILAGVWITTVSPERKQASTLSAEVSAAETQLSTAEGQLANARHAQTQYASAYSSLVSLGKAVPTSQEVPALIDQLTQASHERSVDFSSIVSGAGSVASTAGATSASTSAFSAMPFTFTFSGSFFDLEHLFRQLTSFTTRATSGALSVSGRLLTIQSVKLAPGASEGETGNGNELTGSITASAYVLPGGQTLTGATGAPTAGTSLTPTTGAASSPAPAAIVTVKP
jgi:Tfp pilus assembly protein PilO